MPDLSQFSVLVAGCGSIGRRHIANLRQLGVKRLAAYEPDRDRLAAVVSELGVEPYCDFFQGLETRPEAVFICSPPVNHVQQAHEAINAGCHVFIEKPLSADLDGTEQLTASVRARGCVAQVGYNLRFHPGLQKLEQLIAGGSLGRILFAEAEAAQYLPDWRPWQDYRQSYTAQRQLGGGILLDGSHELDYLTWLLGKPVEVMCMASKVSALEVNVEDCADLLLRFASGTQSHIHLDFVQQGFTKSCKLVGECGTALWDYSTQEVRLFSGKTKSWQIFPYSFETNDMYVAEIVDFFSCIIHEKEPRVSLGQAIEVLELIMKAKLAATRNPGKSAS